MPWEWSHTTEAYENARAHLYALERATLAEIWAEWQASGDGCEHELFDDGHCEACYQDALANSCALPTDSLADDIWQWAEDQRTCDVGGFNAWLCPHGCSPHCVPFDPPTETHTITLRASGAAFEDQRAELARILRGLAEHVENEGALPSTVRDVNGNRCGECETETE